MGFWDLLTLAASVCVPGKHPKHQSISCSVTKTFCSPVHETRKFEKNSGVPLSQESEHRVIDREGPSETL